MIEAHAPGKLLLTGEYAVLDGSPAVVTAVDVAATARLAPAGSGSLAGESSAPFIVEPGVGLVWTESDPGERGALLSAVAAELENRWPGRCPLQFAVQLDSQAFRIAGPQGETHKLGLGSSAAVLGALAGGLFAAAGLPSAALTELALDAHRRFQGGTGSGADVLAALNGGLLVVDVEQHGARALTWPAGLHLIAVWSGESASTSAMIARYAKARDGHAAEHSTFQSLYTAARQAAQAWSGGDAGEICESVKRYAQSLAALDELAGLGIYTNSHRQLEQLAARMGATYKTSGAGGGDIGFALTADAELAGDLRRAFSDAGFLVLDLDVAAAGLTVSGP